MALTSAAPGAETGESLAWTELVKTTSVGESPWGVLCSERAKDTEERWLYTQQGA